MKLIFLIVASLRNSLYSFGVNLNFNYLKLPFILNLLLTAGLEAQFKPHPHFRNYTTEQGLASSENYCILQDKQGYIWISSDNGISRFNGYSFQNFGAKDGLTENVFFELRLDSLGRVWAQSMAGNLYYWNIYKFLPYKFNCIIGDYSKNSTYIKGFIVEGSGEIVHVSTMNKGIISIFANGNSVNYFSTSMIDKQVFRLKNQVINASVRNTTISTIDTVDGSGLNIIHMAFYENGKYHFSHNLTCYTIPIKPSIRAFFLGNSQYLIQVNDRIYLIENEIVKWSISYPFIILDAKVLSDGRFWIGLHEHKGLMVYNSLEELKNMLGTNWLKGQSISHIFEDESKGIWLCTNDNGIYYTPANGIMAYDRESGLANIKVTALSVNANKEIYVGFIDGTVWQLNIQNNIWTKLPDVPGSDFVKSLYFDQQHHNLWACRSELYKLKDNVWVKTIVKYENRYVSIGNHLSVSPNKKLMWSCNHMGFMSINLTNNSVLESSLGYGHRTYAVQQDFSNKVWVGQPKGLYEWKDGKLESQAQITEAFKYRIEDMGLLPDSTLIVATKGKGLVFWKRDSLNELNISNGLVSDMLECVYVDAKSQIWVGTLNGLNSIRGSFGNWKIEQFTAHHGLPSNEINDIVSDGERIWLGTNAGLVYLAQNEKSVNAVQPIITEVLVNNTKVEPNSDLIFKYFQKNVTINFNALNYRMNGRIPYRYRFNFENWDLTYNIELSFPSLQPGNYNFELQAQNENGFWSPSQSIAFIIKPPWWNTIWSKLLVVCLGIMMSLYFYKSKIRSLNKEHQINLKLKELEQAALQAQMNPHFIFNCLNSIQHFIMQNDKEKAIHYLGLFAHLIRSILNASVEGKIFLEDEIKLLKNYLLLESLRFNGKFDFELHVNPTMDLYGVKIPPLLIQPYVENAVKHGVSNIDTGGRIDIYFSLIDNFLEVKVCDNGKILIKKYESNENITDHKSYGMSITQNRLELVNSKNNESVVKIQQILDELGAKTGTMVTIRIKCFNNTEVLN